MTLAAHYIDYDYVQIDMTIYLMDYSTASSYMLK